MTDNAKIRAPSQEGVLDATRKIAEILPATPLLPLDIEGKRIWAKAESLQPIGAFKIRGAWHRLSAMSAEERARGVVAVSSGNHAQGVAWAAKRLGMNAWIVMPQDAPKIKLERTKALGAEIITYDRMTENREEIAQSLVEKLHATLLHAFADSWVIEGQGSTGTEIEAQLAAMGEAPASRIIAPCGGGGLSAGLALALPEAEIIAVEPEGWDDVGRSLACGTIQSVQDNPPKTQCDALQTLATFPINFEILQRRNVQALSVSEREVQAAQRFVFSQLRLVLEPGGAAALAAVLSGKIAIEGQSVVVLSGGNVDPAPFAQNLMHA